LRKGLARRLRPIKRGRRARSAASALCDQKKKGERKDVFFLVVPAKSLQKAAREKKGRGGKNHHRAPVCGRGGSDQTIQAQKREHSRRWLCSEKTKNSSTKKKRKKSRNASAPTFEADVDYIEGAACWRRCRKRRGESFILVRSIKTFSSCAN